MSSQNRAEGGYAKGRGSDDLASLKESGDLEYAADGMIFLHPSADRCTDPLAVALELADAKNRYGSLGRVGSYFGRTSGNSATEEPSKAAA